MNELRELHVAIEEFDTDVSRFTVETVAIEAIDTYGYSPQMDRLFVRLGLESSTALYDTVTVSQESVVDWVKTKVKALTDKAQALANKVYAKITGRSDEIRELLAKADAGEEVKLPISKGAALAGVAVVVAAAGAITFLTGSLARKKLSTGKTAAPAAEAPKAEEKKPEAPAAEAGEKKPGVADKIKDAATKARDKVAGIVKREKHVAENKMNVAEGDIAKAEAQVKAAQDKAAATGEGEEVKGSFLRELGTKLTTALASLRSAIGKFFAEVSAKAREDQEDTKGLMGRVRVCGRFITAVLKMAWAGISTGAEHALRAIRAGAKRAKDAAKAGADHVKGAAEAGVKHVKEAVKKPEEKKPEAAAEAIQGFGRL